MIDADIQDLDLQQEALAEFQKPQTQAVQSIDLNDESISAALRGQDLLQDVNKALAEHLGREKARELLNEVREHCQGGATLTPDVIRKITPSIIQHTTLTEKAELMEALLEASPSADTVTSILSVLESIDFGARLNAEERSEFLPADADRLGKLLSLTPTLEQGQVLSDTYARAQLEQLARGLQDQDQRTHYLDGQRTLAELVGVLEHVSSEQRLDFVKDLLQVASYNAATSVFLADKLDNVGHFLAANEKSALINYVLDELDSRDPGDLICKTLRACRDLKELCEVVALSGEDRLLTLSDIELKEYLAQAKITPLVRDVEFPDSPGGQLTTEQLESFKQDFLEGLARIEDICTRFEDYRNTSVARQYLITASDDRYQLSQDINRLDTAEEGISLSQVKDLIEKYSLEAKVEFQYGVNLTRGASDYLSRSDANSISLDEFGIDASLIPQNPDQISTRADWTLKDLKSIEDVLSRIPEGDVLFSDLLNTIERVPFLGWGVLGARYPGTGNIKIADLTIENQGIARQYEGIASLKIVLAHEIGHGLQIGDGRSGIYFPSEGDPYFGNGEEIHDFDEWMKLSGWKVYERERVESGETSGTIKVDGIQYPLDVPVDMNGERVVLLYNPQWNLLMSYNANADFSSRWYSKVSPWEDFAEAFSEYLYLPERLIQDAPQKFRHLEEEFKRYDNNQHLEELLERALQRERRQQTENPHDASETNNTWVI